MGIYKCMGLCLFFAIFQARDIRWELFGPVVCRGVGCNDETFWEGFTRDFRACGKLRNLFSNVCRAVKSLMARR